MLEKTPGICHYEITHSPKTLCKCKRAFQTWLTPCSPAMDNVPGPSASRIPFTRTQSEAERGDKDCVCPCRAAPTFSPFVLVVSVIMKIGLVIAMGVLANMFYKYYRRTRKWLNSRQAIVNWFYRYPMPNSPHRPHRYWDINLFEGIHGYGGKDV